MTDINETISDLVNAGLIGPAEITRARPLIEAWTEDEDAAASGWALDYLLWTTDSVDWNIGLVPGVLRALLVALGVDDRIRGYE